MSGLNKEKLQGDIRPRTPQRETSRRHIRPPTPPSILYPYLVKSAVLLQASCNDDEAINCTHKPTHLRPGASTKGEWSAEAPETHGHGKAYHGSCSRVEPGPTKGAPHRRPQRLPLPHQGPTTTPALVARPRLYFAFQRTEFQTCSSCLSLPPWPLPCVASLTVLSPPASLRSLLLVPLSSQCVVPALSPTHTPVSQVSCATESVYLLASLCFMCTAYCFIIIIIDSCYRAEIVLVDEGAD